MKYHRIIPIIIGCSLLTIVLHNSFTSVLISNIVDVTDEIPHPLNSKQIISMFDMDRGLRSLYGFHFRLVLLTDTRPAHIHSAHLQHVPFYNWNPQKRKEEVAIFKAEIDSIYQLLTEEEGNRSKSVVWSTILDELAYLNTIRAQKRIVLVQSNLYENSTFSYVHDYETLTDTTVLRDAFIEIGTPPKCRRTHIWLLYDPLSYADGLRFDHISSVVQQMLEEYSCSVQIGSSLH